MKKRVSKKSKRRLMIFGVLSMVSIGYFFATLFLYSFKFINLKTEEKDLNNELVLLQEKKDDLKIEIEKLNDPEYLARFAKENFLYSSDGEYVIKIDDKNPEVIKIKKDYSFVMIPIIVILIIVLFIKLFKKKSK